MCDHVCNYAHILLQKGHYKITVCAGKPQPAIKDTAQKPQICTITLLLSCPLRGVKDIR